ncbi:MAG: hypothetical protein EP311_00910 [Cytophagales bacterium]|uniref:Outer membrane protein beta-barrel domain-containing protein n=1 Tax=Algoriphagus taiwanensis TaxID=1445656 RepID=A0ABQ6Q4C1_9BACT|nr:MAG: hypothetical protein EP311_00910 [Cytophagales bacterium]GMQ34405.1 hypothetical protein Ataiwa_26770 [Algoriphagus taiwanensis]
MKKLLILLFLTTATFAKAQDLYSVETKVPYQSVFLEVGGAGLPYSFNYDFRFDRSRMDSWGMRLGFGGYTTDGDSFFSLPIMVNKLYGKGPHYFELGFGATLFAFDEYSYSYCANGFFDSNGQYICTSTVQETSSYNYILDVDGSPSVMGTMNFGYRRVPVDGGFTWRVALTPIFNNNGFWPLYAGFGFGYAF